MIVFDAHLDLAWNAIDWNRDLRLSVEAIRAAENSSEVKDFKARGVNTVSFHVRRIYDKLQVHSKSEAVAKALKNNLV